MNTFKPLLLATSLTLALSASFLSGCSSNAQPTADKQTAEAKDKDGEKKKEEVAIPVEVATVTQGDIAATLTGTTTLEAEGHASVVAKVTGIATKLFVEEGQSVNAGDPLLQLDTEKLALELQRAESTLGKLKHELDRTRELLDRKLVAREAFDKLRYDYETQKSAFELSRLDLQYATVRAPISGVISKRVAKVGNMVTANQALFEITDFTPLLAVIHVPEKDIGKLRHQQQAAVLTDAFRDQPFAANILRISPVVDAATGTVKVTLAVKDEQQKLRPGMFGRVAITWDEHRDTLLVNKESVLSEDGAPVLFVVREGKAHRTVVKTGYQSGQRIEILEGVKKDDRIVITGQNSLKHEAKVNVLNNAP